MIASAWAEKTATLTPPSAGVTPSGSGRPWPGWSIEDAEMSACPSFSIALPEWITEARSLALLRCGPEAVCGCEWRRPGDGSRPRIIERLGSRDMAWRAPPG